MTFGHLIPRFGASWCATGLLAAAALLPMSAATAADDFLPVEQAFAMKTDVADAHTVRVAFGIAPGYHLYRERLAVEAQPAAAMAGTAVMPKGRIVHDDNFDKDMEIYAEPVQITVPVSASKPFTLVVSHQGCADKGLCYPPQTTNLRVDADASGVTGVRVMADAEPPTAAAAATPNASETAPAEAPDRVQQALNSGSLITIAGVFLLAGLLLSFTPCVLPMVPILSSIIVGQSGTMSRSRGFGLSLSYSLGMALVYTTFGVVAGLLGEGLAAALQNPWVLGAFALMLGALSLSMFGVYQLQMPSSVQSRLNDWTGRLQGGQAVGVFVMGGLSALIVGPCVAAPLAGALVYISQTRDVVIGGTALFSLAMGMSVPLLLVGLSAGSLLPRAGAWMERVKSVFGVLLLAVALWMVTPVLPGWAVMAAWGALLLGCAVFLHVLDPLPLDAPAGTRLFKAVGVVMAVVGLAQWIGALSGGQDATQPLKHLASARGGAGLVSTAQAANRPADEVRFTRVRSAQELEAAIAAAGKPVMLDFYADWCVSCKEYERFTFSDDAVRGKLADVHKLQVDVTANTPEDKALLKRFGLFGPPGVVFFDAQGRQRDRVVGYLDAEAFMQRLTRAGL